MKTSLVKQLTFWYALILIGVTCVLFISFFLLTKKYLTYETDRSLDTHATQVANNISANSLSIHDEKTRTLISINEMDIPGMYMEIVDPLGIRSTGEKSTFNSLVSRSLETNKPIYIQTKLGNNEMRIISYPINKGEKVLGAVIMGHTIDIYNKTLDQLRNVGFFVLIFLIIPGVITGYFLAKKFLNPITKLSMDINEITTDNLTRKIEVTPNSSEAKTLIDNFNSLLSRIQNSFNLERQFLGEMAHEIKTPLTVIKSNCELTLSKDRSLEEYKEATSQILKQTDKLSANLVSLMDFAWTQDISITQYFDSVNLSTLMTEISDLAEYNAKPKEIDVKSNIENRIFIKGKEHRLFQAISNIVDNSIKYNEKGGSIKLVLKRLENKAVIEITDTGMGIAQDKLQNIFNRFYRTEDNKNISGHGLGLAITEAIIKAHSGSIDVTSKISEGSTFVIKLNLSS